MLKLFAVAVICVLAVRAVDITSMDCTDADKVCSAKDAVGKTVLYAKTLPNAISEIKPAPPTPCDATKVICVSKNTIGNTIKFEGKTTNAAVDRFKFVVNGQTDIFTMLVRPPTDPACPGGATCTTPRFVDVALAGAVKSTDVDLAFPTDNPTKKAYKSDGATEVADVFGPTGVTVTVKSGSTVVTVQGKLNDASVDRLRFTQGGNVIILMLQKTGTAPACPAGATCTTPPSVDARANIPSTDVTLNVPTGTLSVEGYNDNTLVASQTDTSTGCNPANIICLSIKSGATKLTLGGTLTSTEVARLKFEQGSNNALTMIKRPADVPCPAGSQCTTPYAVEISSTGIIATTTLTLPSEATAMTAEAYNGATKIDNLFGTTNCNPANVLCATLETAEKQIAFNGKVDKQQTFEIKLDNNDVWKFSFNKAITNTVSFTACIVALFLSATTQ